VRQKIAKKKKIVWWLSSLNCDVRKLRLAADEATEFAQQIAQSAFVLKERVWSGNKLESTDGSRCLLDRVGDRR